MPQGDRPRCGEPDLNGRTGKTVWAEGDGLQFMVHDLHVCVETKLCRNELGVSTTSLQYALEPDANGLNRRVTRTAPRICASRGDNPLGNIGSSLSSPHLRGRAFASSLSHQIPS
jgi:hypothetical protein